MVGSNIPGYGLSEKVDGDLHPPETSLSVLSGATSSFPEHFDISHPFALLDARQILRRQTIRGMLSKLVEGVRLSRNPTENPVAPRVAGKCQEERNDFLG